MKEEIFNLENISPLEIFGVNNVRLLQLKNAFPGIVFVARGHELKIRGPELTVKLSSDIIEKIIREIEMTGGISEDRFTEYLILEGMSGDQHMTASEDYLLTGTRGKNIRPMTEGQKELVKAAELNDIVFAIGPAGTGKTYIAVALAIKALKEKRIRKIFLVRPAVEAGEQLGFLPGDLKEKIDPYLRPLYDALEDMVHAEKLKAYLEKNIIEIAPLAYMRGRTLSDAFVILDESQNATEAQFKMFLTRLGKGSRIIITGDDTQVDLPRHMRSGLMQALRILQNIEGIDFVRLKPSDVVRHKLVKRIIAAYEKEGAAKRDSRDQNG